MKEGFVKSEGIVIKKMRYRETSALIEVFTPVMGRHTLIARGIYRKRRPFSSHLEPLSLNSIEFMYREGREIHPLTKAELLFYPEKIMQNLEAFNYAAKSMKIIRRQEYLTESIKDIFVILREEIERLNEGGGWSSAYLDFLRSYLYLEGHITEMAVSEGDGGRSTLREISKLERILKYNDA